MPQTISFVQTTMNVELKKCIPKIDIDGSIVRDNGIVKTCGDPRGEDGFCSVDQNQHCDNGLSYTAVGDDFGRCKDQFDFCNPGFDFAGGIPPKNYNGNPMWCRRGKIQSRTF